MASIATMGAELSRVLYGLVMTIYEVRKEISFVGDDVSLLAIVFEELEEVV